MTHMCDSFDAPYLIFSYTKELELKCGCTHRPIYQSTYIHKDLCPEHHCDEDDHPVLDWDDVEQKCVCRTHPCENVEGLKHECHDHNFPILRYRLGENGAPPTCECTPRLEHPKETAIDL